MKSLTSLAGGFTFASVMGTLASGCTVAADPPVDDVAEVVIEAKAGVARPPYSFSAEDSALLEEVQHGCFRYFWEHVAPETGMVYDRTSVPVVSVAGVGFQLSAIPIGIEHGWITGDEGRERVELILRSLSGNPSNRKHGLYYHYLDGVSAGPYGRDYEMVVSTIDSALLLAGVATASAYFGDEIAELADRMIAEADWKSLVVRESDKPYERGFVSLGWRPRDAGNPTGEGDLLPYVWADAGDEQRLVMFLAVAASVESHRVDPSIYYRLRRRLGEDGDGPFVWFPWSGALFTAFFSHCWIDYAARGPDDPAAHGVAHRPRVDWWENSRRIVRMHQRRAQANHGSSTLGRDAWGLTASDAPSGYAVPGYFPRPLPMPGAVPEFDYSTFEPKEDPGDGTIAPYAAGCSIVFDPRRSIEALKHYRGLEGSTGASLVWRSPDEGGWGFVDAFNLDGPWVAPDCVAIDQGPLIICIENARSGKVWQWFGKHSVAKSGRVNLGWEAPR